ncbi:endothelin-converting enzyme homolog [Hydra vulgaris]|uniref:endothelin-converting enzyme homolog n=1 Tax=Hydra vulgaris TaxID=6087 RepID=UPI000641319A|nr:endothelin-converting enzyme homolog [Hydra vulgaris]XP_012554973.1 endothelin-converting enzyme homolog [Hydra vulgaris]XP_047124595.1 endothelin-converting enzyme homolog [Hydra vulgaris]XP_047124596.1 endothelin-converting enzyme homolog [Hydra vulgaris]XP_047124597.1 endothelin-converting enzyme homolog [Hydra vulgaris]
MRVYFNPCFNKSMPVEKTETKKPLKKEHNFSSSSNSSRSEDQSAARYNGSCVVQHNEDVDDEVIYSGTDNAHKAKQKRTLCFVFFGTALLVASGIIITILAVKLLKANATTRAKKGNESCLTHEEELNQYDACTCKTPVCLKIAKSIKNSMNFSADPCHDFNEYVCGRWHESHPLPASEDSIFPLKMANLYKNKELRVLVEDLTKKPIKRKGFKSKIAQYYRSCTDVTTIEKKGKYPLLEFLSNFGIWSPIKTWSEVGDRNDLTSIIIRSHEYFTFSIENDKLYSPLFKGYVTSNSENPTQHITEISPPDLPLEPDMYMSEEEEDKKILGKYKNLLVNYVALLGPDKDAEKNIEELLNFEKNVAQILVSPAVKDNITRDANNTSIQNFLNTIGNQIDWLRVISSLFKPFSVKVSNETIVSISSFEYFKQLNNLLTKTNPQIVKDYIIWICVWKFGSYASAPFLEADHSFQKAISGVENQPERWRKCIMDLEQTMGFALSSLYVEKSLKEEDKSKASEIIENVRKEFKNNLVNADWMDVATKAAAFKKVDFMLSNVGFPEFIKNEQAVDKLYEKIVVNEKSYFKNILEMYKDKRLSNLGLINQPVDRSSYDLPPTIADAFYNKQKNKMAFMAGLLHPPFYSPDVPMALNYGAMGLVAGHEITHAFDDRGRFFDELGEHRNWWSESSQNAFEKRSECVNHQYSNYSIFGMPINGVLTLNENIADNGGIKVSFMAYREWLNHQQDKKLPGLSFTPEQLFFVYQGQIWCGTYREQYMRKFLSGSNHSPNKFRIIGSYSNLDEFSSAFKCPLGSTMNPLKKCRVW